MAYSIQKIERGTFYLLVIVADTEEELNALRANAVEKKGWTFYLDGTCPKTHRKSIWLTKDKPTASTD